MFKILTGVIDNITDYLEENNILPVEQKGDKRRNKGTKDQLLIDKGRNPIPVNSEVIPL